VSAAAQEGNVTASRIRHPVVVGLVAWLILLTSDVGAQDTLARAKDLYLSAAYDEALVLLEQLKDAGLFEDEAQSLVDVWKQEFFQAEGLTLFYRIPQEQYEKILPLTMKPKPVKLIRVGLVHRPYYDPALAEKVAGLVNDLNDDDYQKREQAQESLVQLGRSAFAHLKVHQNKTTAPEIKRRLDEILKKYDATEAMRP
jgi:hypothetical protein